MNRLDWYKMLYECPNGHQKEVDHYPSYAASCAKNGLNPDGTTPEGGLWVGQITFGYRCEECGLEAKRI